MDDFNTPNLVLPMAASYTTRGSPSYSAFDSAGIDQRKINCYYETISNPKGGGSLVSLCKRNGFALAPLVSSAGSASSLAYIITTRLGGSGRSGNVYKRKDGAVRAAQVSGSPTTDQFIVSDSATVLYYPYHASQAIYSGQFYTVLQVCWSSGTTTSASHRAFVIDESTSPTGTEISASEFGAILAVGGMCHIDGFAFLMDSTGNIRNSNINDLYTWPTTNSIKKQSIGDRPMGLIKHNRLLLAFGNSSVEGFENRGNPSGSPLTRTGLNESIGLLVPSSVTSYGLQNSYYCMIDGVTYFIGYWSAPGYATTAGSSLYLDSKNVLGFDGSKFFKVSTPGIDRILAATNPFYGIGEIRVFGKSALYIQLTDNTTTPQKWLMYFPEDREWFEWSSPFTQPQNNGTLFIGAGINNGPLLWSIGSARRDQETAASFSAIDALLQFRIPRNKNSREGMAWAGIVADSQSASVSTSVGCFAQISFSDDDYQTFSTPRQVDLRKRRKQVYRCGSYDDRVVRLTHSGDADFRVQAFIAKTL